MKVCSLLKICLMTCALIATTQITVAETSILSTSQNKQKQWVGTPAPNFKLQDQNGKWHELKQYQGKWLVLYFYPKDNSPGCTEEANQFKTLYEALYRVKQIQGYGALYQITDNLNMEEFDALYKTLIEEIAKKESPASVLEKPQELILDSRYKVISRKSYFRYLRTL